MRLVTFSSGDAPRLGLVVGERVVDLAAAGKGDVPADMLGVIRGGPSALETVRRAAESASGQSLPLAEVKLHAPIVRPTRNVFALGLNYAEHVMEGARARSEEVKLPEYPVFFSKVADCVIGPGELVEFDPKVSTHIDWEVELAVIIGREGRDIPKNRAFDFIFGYTVANDVTARDLQRRHGGQWHKGKSLDTFCPLGPWIVTADEVSDVQNLRITSRINGQTMQDSNTRHMIFPVATILESLSQGLTLKPGDVIITGTPDGVGFARKPPVYLRDGDVAEMEVEGIGVLRNTIRERRG